MNIISFIISFREDPEVAPLPCLSPDMKDDSSMLRPEVNRRIYASARARKRVYGSL